MSHGGPPKENIGPTQGWSGGPPSAPGPRTRTDAGIPASGGPATTEALPAPEAKAEAERVAAATDEPEDGDPEREAEHRPPLLSSLGGRGGGLLVVGLLTSAACMRGLARPPPADVMLERRSPPVVSHAGAMELAVRNTTKQPIAIPRPSEAFLLVSASTGEGRVLQCRTPPRPELDVEIVVLDPGDVLPIDVDPQERCHGARTQDDLRVVVRFAVPSAFGERPRGTATWTGVTPPVHVQILPQSD